MQRSSAPLFANGRAVILYNPHFDHGLGSWHKFAADLIDAVIADGRFNLIVAPHIRMFEHASAAARDAWQARAVPGRVIVDLGSPRLSDMSYTSAADIYVGDVSSQVYEFLTIAKPCIFLDAHGADWRGNPDYAMWQFGPVVSDLQQMLSALGRAASNHADYITLQRAMVAERVGDCGERAAEVAADQLIEALTRTGHLELKFGLL
jgi:CDP-glycerol glycerophosphotransferase (TagB/SpsB family)